jgi:competence protein ComEC
MGSVALIGLGTGGRERGVRVLGVAVWALLLLDPWMALSIGFALSSLATAGILFLAPPCRDALAAWMPRWLAEAVAVPLAAQLACTPLVAAVSGQVSLVALVANMLVAPAVGPATVLGLAGGFVVLAVEPLGMVLGRLAGWCAWWIVAVAQQSADLPTAAVGWSTGALPLLLLTLLCVLIGWVLPALLDRRRWVLPLALVMLLVVVRPLPTPGWPPPGWLMVMCDVGQGDGLVLNAGSTGVVVVDTGPDPELIDACLDRLEVERVATVVLSHFHADHVGGLPGILAERPPDALLVTGFAEPAENAAEVRTQAARAGVPVRVPEVGSLLQVGPLTLQVLGPVGRFATGTAPAEGSPANNASLTLLAQARGIRILLPGDSEPEAQHQLALSYPHLRVDVLKVPHHGSSYQSTDFLTGLDARVALVPVGAENSYGHPSPRVLDLLEDTGAVVRRTDRAGDVAVVVGAGGQLTLRELSTSSSAMR